MKKKWKFKETAKQGEILALADSLNISNVLANLLIQRNIKNFFEAKSFFRPELENLLDPMLMDGMEKASTRVIKAITNNERITVYGDYDVDGTCSATIMYLFLKELGANVDVYIPNRINDGYGISMRGIDQIHKLGTNLIISVDCGITAIDEVDHANSLGIDVIISDHHKAKDELPRAHAVLDPIKPGCNYPFKHLSGAGVAFKLARAIGDRFGRKDLPLRYLDLVALASSADIVSLTGENRILVRKGIEQINEKPSPGIKALMKCARMEPGNLSSGQIVFSIAPRINAVGRLGDANRAVELFISETVEEADRIADILERENYERRKIDELTYSHAIEKAEATFNPETDLGIVLHDDNWHPGVIGIVASRLVEKYYRPAVMLTTIDGVAKGSARSISGFNIYAALKGCEDLLLQYGGHDAAAGVAIPLDKVDEFRLRFNEVLKTSLKIESTTPEIDVDSKLSFSEITPKFIRILEQFSPFGPGNMRPVFYSDNVRIMYSPRLVGKNHIIMSLKQENCDKVFDAIGFNLGEYMDQIDFIDDLIDIVYSIESVMKEGRSFPQLRIKDIRIKK